MMKILYTVIFFSFAGSFAYANANNINDNQQIFKSKSNISVVELSNTENNEIEGKVWVWVARSIVIYVTERVAERVWDAGAGEYVIEYVDKVIEKTKEVYEKVWED